MEVIKEIRGVLERANYAVAQPDPEHSVLHFEDDSVFGFVWFAPTLERLLSGWRIQQDAFLKQHANRIRASAFKAWNAYSVFVTEESASDQQVAALIAIEEDFRSTRKIARAGVVIPDDVTAALQPLLPLRHAISASALSKSQVRDRLESSLEPTLVSALDRIVRAADEKSRKTLLEEVASMFLRRA